MTDDALLHKVRSLLAKAESTDYPDEAEALTAKAQELMDRHAIDEAMLGPPPGGPERREIRIERPYVTPKFLLLSRVAEANRCRAVLHRGTETATVVGFPADQATVEVLFTSLLVQATGAMLREGRRPENRGRGFRHAFLLAFAHTIGDRLREAAEATVAAAAADHGAALLPVLATRADAVDRATTDAFPDLGRLRTSVSSAGGVAAGREAGQRADLSARAEVRRRRDGALPR